MKYEVGDLFLIDGRLWTLIQKKKGHPLVLESGERTANIYSYEIKDWMKLYIGSKYYPVVKE